MDSFLLNNKAKVNTGTRTLNANDDDDGGDGGGGGDDDVGDDDKANVNTGSDRVFFSSLALPLKIISTNKLI